MGGGLRQRHQYVRLGSDGCIELRRTGLQHLRLRDGRTTAKDARFFAPVSGEFSERLCGNGVSAPIDNGLAIQHGGFSVGRL
jgi:hypothetical protein